MEVVHYPGAGPAPGAGSVVTIGAYDGVHLGHRALIGEVRRRAEALSAASAVVTFDRHPASVVRPESAPLLLTDLDQKLELLASTGIDLTVVVRFDEERASESAEDFVNELLVQRLAARVVVVGEDFHFGHGRRGNVELLRRMGAGCGFEVIGHRLVAEAGSAISSTRIRRLLGEGDVAGAAALLGRHHEVRGQVVKGDGRAGADLGMPTANVAVPPGILLPVDGIYAGWYRRPEGGLRRAALSLGRRPTFYPDGGPRLLEAHLLDFEGDLYGEAAAVSFVGRIREERTYDSLEPLIAQMQEDVADTRRILGS
ncbi:MAG TPA: bifunctional riboflavin kinase/FAD synthetase [Acidimicrobiales bacterium]|nr:bifunctional riboflavin kinase/FAD synthetase [Acidimicrobiales bacterium]